MFVSTDQFSKWDLNAYRKQKEFSILSKNEKKNDKNEITYNVSILINFVIVELEYQRIFSKTFSECPQAAITMGKLRRKINSMWHIDFNKLNCAEIEYKFSFLIRLLRAAH